MTSQGEVDYEVERQKKATRLLRVCDGGFAGKIRKSGGVLTGFSVKVGDEDYLMTIRAEYDGNKVISWVGASSLQNLLLKAYREAARENLRWKADEWD